MNWHFWQNNDFIPDMSKIKKVYIAGEDGEEIDKTLRIAGYETFLSARDGLSYVEIAKRLQFEYDYPKKLADTISLKLAVHFNIHQICKLCDAMIVNLNGLMPDDSSVMEAAICFRSRLPLVFYKKDDRRPLIAGLTDFEVLNKMEDIPKKLKELEERELELSDYSRVMNTAEKLFRNYDHKNLDQLARLGKELFAT